MPGKVYVIGVGMTKFEKPGSRPDFDYPDMTKEAVTKALADAKMKYNEIQQACVGYVYGDSTCGQRALYPLGMTGIPIYNVNNNCSTGSSALFLAQQLVAGGIADCVLALGFEKMERGSLMSKYDDRTNPMDRHVEVLADTVGLSAGPITAQMFGAAAAEHMTKYGTKAIHLAKIAHKNHKHSKNNPNSQFQKGFSLQEIIDAPLVAEAGPLTKLQCCPTSDGAAAVILASEDFVKKNGLEKQAVEIVGMEMSTDLSSSFEQKSCMNMVGYDMTCKAAERLYTKTGVRPTDISVVECHDCFSGNELLVYSALQLCKPEETGSFIDRNDNTYGGKYVVNPSGGLIAKGHPLGATGLAQCCELSWQLRGEAGPRQVPNVKFALQHNIGLGGAVVLAIYKKGFTDNKKMPSNDTNSNSDEFKSAPIIRQFAVALEADGARLVQKVKGVFAFKVKNGPGGKEAVWIVDAKNGSGSVSFEGKGPSPDVTLVIADSDLSDLLAGKAQPQKLFFQGKLKVQGNMGLAMKLQDLQKEVDAVTKPKSKL